MSTDGRLSAVRDTVRLALEKEISFLAGSLAFFAFVSLVPAMVLVLAAGSILGGEAFANGIVGLVERGLSDEGTEVLQTALADSTGLAGASVLGLFVLLWSTLRVFRALDIAFNRIYQADSSSSFLQQLLNGSIVALSITTALLLLFLVRSTVRRLAVPYANLLTVPLVLLGLLAVLTPLYYVMTPVPVTVRQVLPGTLAAVVGLLLLHQSFHVYTSQATQYQAYGFVGAVLLFLLWLYIGAIVLLFGAVVNASLLELQRPHETSVSATPRSVALNGHSDEHNTTLQNGENLREESEERVDN